MTNTIVQLKLITGEEIVAEKIFSGTFKDPLLIDRVQVEDEFNTSLTTLYMIKAWYLNQYEETPTRILTIKREHIVAEMPASNGVANQYSKMLDYIIKQQKDASKSEYQRVYSFDDDSDSDNLIRPNFTGPRSIN